jgi:hypothetical protein
MSAAVVHDALINMCRTDTVLDAEFSTTLSGLISSNGQNVTGDANTLFSSELKEGDYIGDISHGYRRVESITDDHTLTIDSPFSSDYSAETAKRSDINKGIPDDLNLTNVGKVLRIALLMTADINSNAAGDQLMVAYGFNFVLGFYEPVTENVDSRISDYDVMLRNVIDKDPTIGGVCEGNTEMATFDVDDSLTSEGVYIGNLPIVCYRFETRGNR